METRVRDNLVVIESVSLAIYLLVTAYYYMEIHDKDLMRWEWFVDNY
ncbi:MAG: hypothetical protein ACI88A_002011 [Paraglaciecola sp.]|jgi:hypothetical protein